MHAMSSAILENLNPKPSTLTLNLNPNPKPLTLNPKPRMKDPQNGDCPSYATSHCGICS